MESKKFIEQFSETDLNIKELIERADNLGVTAMEIRQEAETSPIVYVDASFVLFLGKEKDEGI